MKKKTKIIISYLILVFSISILLMSLWITLDINTLPKIFQYIGTGILYLATFAGLLRGIIWTVEHFIKWIDSKNIDDEA